MGALQVSSLADALAVLAEECSLHTQSQDMLLVRYEWQQDHSLLGEDLFGHEPAWALERIRCHLAYWRGLREADPVPEGDTWKCLHCAFSALCSVGQGRLELQKQQEEEERERVRRRRKSYQGRIQKKGRTGGGGSGSQTEAEECLGPLGAAAAAPSDQRTLDFWLKTAAS